jgi:hypothetical protein
MCAFCGFPQSKGHWSEAGFADAHQRLRGRFLRAAAINKLLKPLGVTAHEDGVTPGIQLSDGTGRIEIVADLAAVWLAAEHLSGRKVDPLALSAGFVADGIA